MKSAQQKQCRGGCDHSGVRNTCADQRPFDASKAIVSLQELHHAPFLSLADGGNKGRGICLEGGYAGLVAALAEAGALAPHGHGLMQTSRSRQGEGWPQTAYGAAPISRLAETLQARADPTPHRVQDCRNGRRGATDAAPQLHLQQRGAREDPLDGCGCAERDGGLRATSEPSSVRAFGTHGQAAEVAQAPLEAASEGAEGGERGEWGGERALIGGGELGGERRGQRRRLAADQRGQLVGGASVSAPPC
eukprot:6184674-Pleurochrysis_carterae.AAC.1